MSLTIELPPYVETYLQEEAAKQETPVEEYTAQLIETLVVKPKPRTGAELVARLKEEGIIGMWADRADMQDSTAYVNQLRENIKQDILAKQRVPQTEEQS